MANVLRRRVPAYVYSNYDEAVVTDVGGAVWYAVPSPLWPEFTDWVSLETLQSDNMINNEALGYGVGYFDAWLLATGYVYEDYDTFTTGDLGGNAVWYSELGRTS